MSVKSALGVKTDDEILAEVDAEPTIHDARAALADADRILARLEARAREIRCRLARRGPTR